MADWNHVYDDQANFKKCPYGENIHNYEWKKRAEVDEDYKEDVHAVHQICSMLPGVGHPDCGNDSWRNVYMKAFNKWDKCDFGNPSIHDWDPLDGSGGTIDISIGYSGASLTWSFTVDGSIDHKVSGNRVKWNLGDLWSTEARVDQQKIEPGSICVVDDDNCGERLLLTNTYNETHFENKWTLERHYLGMGYDIYYTNYCNW